MGLPNEITEEEIAAFLARPKFMDEDFNWREESPHSAILWTSGPLLDEQGLTISEHIVDLTYRRGKYKGECKYLFTIFKLVPKRTRLYQIEVVPPKQKSASSQGKAI